MGMHIRVEDGKIAELRFHGKGGAISQAAASIASDEYIGMPLDELSDLDGEWMIELLGIPILARRRTGALLNLKVMRGAVTGDASWPKGWASATDQPNGEVRSSHRCRV